MMEEQFIEYKKQLCKNGIVQYDLPYNNPVFDQLIEFVRLNGDFFFTLMTPEHHVIWNTRGQISLLDKYRQILGMLVYGVDNYYAPRIKNTYAVPNFKKPAIKVKSVDNNDVPLFFGANL